MNGALPIEWKARTIPLAPAAAAATGLAARALGERLLKLGDAELGRYLAVAGEDVLVVLGDADALPWVDGITYLGRDPAAGQLLLPTHSTPTMPIDLLERALLRTAPGPIAVLPAASMLVPIGQAQSIAREPLTTWLGGT